MWKYKKKLKEGQDVEDLLPNSKKTKAPPGSKNEPKPSHSEPAPVAPAEPVEPVEPAEETTDE